MTDPSFDLIGLGLCAWDRLLLFDKYPARNEKVEALASVACGGGPVPTALAAFSKLGGRAAFVGVVGDDAEGERIRLDLAAFGVNIDHLVVRAGAKSSSAQIWVDRRDGARTVALDSGTVAPLAPAELPAALLRSAPMLLIDGRWIESALAAAQLCRSGGGVVILDAGSPRPCHQELLAVTHHAVVSRDFSAGTYPHGSLREILGEFAALGPSSIVITNGAEGGLWWEKGESGSYSAFKAPILDTTGAGDAFHGGYLFAQKQGLGMPRRCSFASAVAALACRALGGRSGLPELAEVLDLCGR